ncbi:hypothetical protein ONE63_003166 [Megalurothrips usitatus]|uniref:Protein MIX23 n=1 Tax=Megalurothrips usitatus TaxID=439358 RepID=A0AAV7X787_9NEOP|nr:hypothetical protein ONE63_003166 [Megalurothrips usitatus]
MEHNQRVECADFQLFQANLNSMRENDDKIINIFNAKLPTNFSRNEVDPTATCKELFSELSSTYVNREKAIKGCITHSANRIKHLALDKERNPDSNGILKELRREQKKLRMLQSELSVEEVVKERSMKVFQDRCRPYYCP